MLLSTLLFFDFSGGEFLLIAVVFLMFFGSKSIPGLARTLGKAVRDFKEAANTVQREINDSVTIEEVKEVKKNTSSSPAITQQATPPPSTIPQETISTIVTKPEISTDSDKTENAEVKV